jgi:hypothetical protein
MKALYSTSASLTFQARLGEAVGGRKMYVGTITGVYRVGMRILRAMKGDRRRTLVALKRRAVHPYSHKESVSRWRIDED